MLVACSAAPVHTGPGPVTFDTIPVSELGAITADKLEQLKQTLGSTKIPIQGTERIDSAFTEKVMEFHRSVTWTLPAASFINESAHEEAAKKKKEEAKKKAEEEKEKAEEEKKKKKEADEAKKDADSEEKDAVASDADKKDTDAEKKAEVVADAAEKKDEAPAEKKEDAAPAAPAATATEEEKPTEEKAASTDADKKDEKDSEKKDEKDAEKKDSDDDKKDEPKKDIEENEAYPEFDEDELNKEDMKDGKAIDIAVVRKSAKFTVSFASVQVVDMVELDFGLARTWFEGSDSLKYKYSMTLEYNTAPRTWSKVWDRLPLDDVFNSSVAGRGKKTRMLQLNTAFRAQKLRFRLHVEKKSEAELDQAKNISASTIRKFSYTDDFDKNGVLYWIGSSFGKSSYSNPQTSGDVTVTLSHSETSGRAVEFVVSHTLIKESASFGGSAPVWFTVDLGPHLTLCPDYYTLRHGFSYSDSIIADWEFQGSNNNETWTSLHGQVEAPFGTGWATKSWAVSSAESFRYFRIYQKGNYAYGLGQGPSGSPYLFIGGLELYGDVFSTSKSLVPNSITALSVSAASLSPSGIEKARSYTFSHDGDTNGVLYAIGSSDGSEKWTNPAKSGKVKTKLSGQSWNDSDKWNCIARASDSNTAAYWGGSLPVWFYVDLGTNYKICPNHYTLRHGNSYNENFMQNWEFQGSNDASTWTMLHSGTDSPFQYSHHMVSWAIKDVKEFYRYFRVLQKSNSINGPGNEAGPYMYISGMEIYGLQDTSSGSSGSTTPAEAQRKRSLANLMLTNEDYHLQLVKAVHADATPYKLRLQCLEMLDAILARNTSVPEHILKAIDVKTFLRLFVSEGDKASCDQGGRWLQYLLAMNHSTEGAKAFRQKLLDAILEVLPTVVNSLQSAHNLDQLSNLLVTSWSSNPELATKTAFDILMDLGQRLRTGLDHHYQILRNRFGLYDFVLESDCFVEPPVPKKPKKADKNNNSNYDEDNDPDNDEESPDADGADGGDDDVEEAGDSGADGDAAVAFEGQLVQAILTYERERSRLRTVLEHLSMNAQPSGAGSKPSPSTVKEVTQAYKETLKAQHAVHRFRTSLQAAAPSHAALKNLHTTVQLDRWNVIAERLLVLLSIQQRTEKKSELTPRTSGLFTVSVTQEMFNLFCLNGSPFMRKTMNSFLRHNSDPKQFAIATLRRLYNDEHMANNDLVPYEEIFGVIRELSSIDESTVVATSRSLLTLLAECSADAQKMDYQLSTWTLRLLRSLLKSNLASPHPYSKCRSCGSAPVRGIRFRCLQCVDYDICAKCEANHPHDPMHTFVKINGVLPLSPTLSDTKLSAKAKEPLLGQSLYHACLTDVTEEAPKWPANATVSHGITCDNCGTAVTGVRFKCINCNQYNLCTQCETQKIEESWVHFKHHIFAKIYHPLPGPSSAEDAKTLVNVLLHPGLYPHPHKKDLPAASDKKEVSEAPAAIPSPTPAADAGSSPSTPASGTSAISAATAASPSVERRTAAEFAASAGKASPSTFMRASTGAPLARKQVAADASSAAVAAGASKEDSPSPSLVEALNAVESEFSVQFLITLVAATNTALTMAQPSYELLLLATSCLRAIAYQYSPEEMLVLVKSSAIVDIISTAAGMGYQYRAAVLSVVQDLCAGATYVNLLKETAETTLKPLRAAFRERIVKMLSSSVKSSAGKKPAASSTASKDAKDVKDVKDAKDSKDSKDSSAESAKPVSAGRLQFLLSLLQSCSDSSDITVEKKAAKVVDWRTASAPLKNFMPSTTTVYPVDATVLSLLWTLLDEQDLSGSTITGDSVQIITTALTLLKFAEAALVVAAPSFQRFVRSTYLSKVIVHRPYWRQFIALLTKLISSSSKDSGHAAIATNTVNNVFQLFTETLTQPAAARDMLLISTFTLLKSKKSLLKPTPADLVKLASLCIKNMPEPKTLDTATEEEYHVFEIEALSLVTTLISSDKYPETSKAELYEAESASPAAAAAAAASVSSLTTSTSGSTPAAAAAASAPTTSTAIVAPIVAWVYACDTFVATKSAALGAATQVHVVRKALVAFLNLLCTLNEGFAKRALTSLAASFKQHKLTSPKLVDWAVELMSTEALASLFIVDLEMGQLLQSELETAEGSVKRSESGAARPTMYEAVPTVPTLLVGGMTNLSSTTKLIQPADDYSAQNVFLYGTVGSTNYQWTHHFNLNKSETDAELNHALVVVRELPQPALLREVWFDLARHYNSTSKIPPSVTFEVGSTLQDLRYVTSLETPGSVALGEQIQTFKVKFDPPQICKYLRVTFERPQGCEILIIGSMPLLGTFNLFEDITLAKEATKGRKPAINALALLEHAFHYDSIRTFYGGYSGTTDLALQLLTMSTEETKNQVQTIALHLARHRPGLVSTLFAHFSKMGIPSSSSRFVGRLCAVADEQTSTRIQTLSDMVFAELVKGESAISAATASADAGSASAAAAPTGDKLIAVTNALSEALFVLLATHREITLKPTGPQVIQIARAALRAGSSLGHEAFVRLLSTLTQADTSRYALLQDHFAVQEGKTDYDFDVNSAMTMLSLLAPLSPEASEHLTQSPILKTLVSDITAARTAKDAADAATVDPAVSAASEASLIRAVNFVRTVSHHPKVKDWVTGNVLEAFLDILSERKFGATVQFAVQSAVRTACNLSQANQEAVAGYLMKVFQAATSTSAAGVSDAMLQLLEDMLNINDKLMVCLHSKNDTSEELLLCDSSSSPTGGAILALDPENSHEDLVLDEDDLGVSGGTKNDYSWKTAIMANAAPSNGPVSWNVTVERSSGSNMMIGVCMKGHSHSIYIGGTSDNDKAGWAFYACSPGYKYHNASATEYGRMFNTGDVIGVHMNQTEGTLSFSINGDDLGVAFTDLPADEPLYPAVSLCQNTDAVKFSGFQLPASGNTASSEIDNKHPLYFQRSNRVSPIALGTPLANIAEILLGSRTDRKVVFSKFGKSSAIAAAPTKDADGKDIPAASDEISHSTTLRELTDCSSEVLDITFALVPIVPEKKDDKKDDKKSSAAKKEGETDEEKEEKEEKEKKEKEKEKEKAEAAKRKTELEAKKKADQTGVMKRFASQKGLEMLVAILTAKLNPKPVAKDETKDETSKDSEKDVASSTDAPATPSTSTDAASTDASATTPATPATDAGDKKKDSESSTGPTDAVSDSKPLNADADLDEDEALARRLAAEDEAEFGEFGYGDEKFDGALGDNDHLSEGGSEYGSAKDEHPEENDEEDGYGGLFGDDFGLDAPPASTSEPKKSSSAAGKKKKGKKDDKKQKKGVVSKATWAKWIKLLGDCLILDGVVDSFVQDEDCRAMLFAVIEAAKTTPTSDASANSLEPLPQPSKQALEAPMLPLYRMLLSTLAAADSAKATQYREQLHKNGLLKGCLVEMMELCDVMPVNTESANFKVEADAIKAEKEEKAAAKKKASAGTTYWAKGTGYGTNSDEKTDFNLTAYVRETVLTGSKVTQLLEVVAFMIGAEAAPATTESADASSAPAGGVQSEINQMVLDSALRPVLEAYLRNDSLLEMSRSLALFKVVFKITQLLSRHECFMSVLVPDESTSNIYTLMEQLQRVANLVQKLPATSEKNMKGKKGKNAKKSTEESATKESTPAATEDAPKDESATTDDSSAATKEDGSSAATKEESAVTAAIASEAGQDEPTDESEKLLALEIQKTFDMLKEKVQAKRDIAKAKAREATEKDTSMSKVDKLIELYCTSLRDLQFGDADMLEKGKDDDYTHHYKQQIKSDSAPGNKKMKRLVQELSVLSTSLPLHPDSSVFLRVDEQRIDICKVLITGPDNTPYDSGCFQFDMYLNADYPKGSPKINLMTTGHGSVRFNPNLYNCGKVCLSLLGTWPGAANEEWNEETSTILQLMISIQSLIFVPEPYFNEPGYESSMTSETGKTQSRQYNENIRTQTLRWAMIDQLKNPSPGFEEIIKTHFRLKKELILEQLDGWMADFVANSEEGPTKEFEKLVAEFTKLLNTV